LKLFDDHRVAFFLSITKTVFMQCHLTLILQFEVNENIFFGVTIYEFLYVRNDKLSSIVKDNGHTEL